MRRFALVGFVGCFLMAGTPRAQSGGLPLGPFEFYPSLTLEAGDDNNIFNQVETDPVPPSPPEDPKGDPGSTPVQDRFLYARAPLVWRLPFRQSSWDLAYTPGWNGYQQYEGLDGATQRFGTLLTLNFSRGSRFEFDGSRVLDYLDTGFDRGGEVVFSDSNYTLDYARMSYEHPMSPRHGFRLEGTREALTFDENVGASFIDYVDYELAASYLNFLRDDTTLFVDLVGSIQYQDRTLIEIEEDEWDRRAVQAGVERRFDAQNRARFYLAYENLEFQNSDDSAFSGVAGHFLYSRLFGGGVRLQADLIRQVTASVFNVNNFYVNDRLQANVEWRPGARLFYRLVAAVQENNYPDDTEQFCRSVSDPNLGVPVDEGPCATVDDGDPDTIDPPILLFPPETIGFKRRDREFRGQAGIGFQFSRTASVELGYEYRTRDSNMDPFDFTTGRISLEFRFGWSPYREFI